ncbi:TerD family protein [Streptomyces sp. NPDC091371]|uniref:TerD family protein n=1 Tax=Streptomyces sp. NPDC091371 TaxID=3155303 RepID=UPI00342DB580
MWHSGLGGLDARGCTGMTVLGKGGNTAITAERVTASLHCAGAPVDLSALLVTADGRVRSDDDMVFYNQPSAESGAVRHRAADAAGPERIEVDPSALPADVDRVVLIASCDPDDATRTFREVSDVRVHAAQAGTDPVEFLPPPLTDGERAVLLLEIYRRGTGWKLRAIGQGYADGLAGLATDFGVTVTPADPTPAPAPTPTPPPTLLKAPLGKISLDKGGQASISLDKQDRELVVTATLEWDGGSEQRRKRGADLDLYALFVPAAQAQRGAKEPGTLVRTGPTSPKDSKAVYYKDLGSLTEPPFIKLDGDAREPGCETLRITRPEEQGYVLLCAYSAVSNGFGSFRSFGAHVVVTDGRGSTVTVPLYENTKTRYWVAIALVDFTTPNGAAIRHIEAYSSRMTERRPVLHADGTIQMNGGPVEFKRPGT